MKILILGPNQINRYNWGHQLFKNEIARQHEVRFWGHGFPGGVCLNVKEILDRLDFNPDIILTYIAKYCRWVTGMDEVSIPRVHIVVDYAPFCFEVTDRFLDSIKPSLVFAVVGHEIVYLRDRHKGKFPVKMLPFSVDTNVFDCSSEPKDKDLMAFFSVVSWIYPSRIQILKVANNWANTSIVGKSGSKTRIMKYDYVKALNRSRIVINGVSKRGALNWKIPETLACGSFLLTDRPGDFAALKYRDGVHCVVFGGPDDLKRKIKYYLKNSEEREKIAATGYEFVRQRHSNEVRVKQLTKMIEATL